MEKVHGIVSGKVLTVSDFKKYQSKGFITTQSDLLKYNGESFEIIRSLTEDEADLENLPMFKIKFKDGHEVDAYMEEIFKDRLFDELIDVNNDLYRE